MNYKTSDVNKIIQKSFHNKEVKQEDIPNIDLYVDQIIRIFEKQWEGNSCDEKLITKSMVNNYSKEKIIAPIKGKKYTKEQILQILLIVNLKNTLSIQEIKKITHALMGANDSEESILQAFSHYEENAKNTEVLSKMLCDGMLNKYDESISTEEMISILLSLAQVSSMLQRTAEIMTKTFFDDVIQEKK